MRTNDILKIKIKDFDDTIINLQSNKVILNKELACQIKNYIDLTKLNSDDFLFSNYTRALKDNHGKNHLTEKSVQDIFNKYKKIVNNNLSIRDLRNSFITNLDNYFSRLEIDKIYKYDTAETDLDYLNYKKIN